MTYHVQPDEPQSHPLAGRAGEPPVLPGTAMDVGLAAFWRPVIVPLLQTIQLRTLVEVGASQGHNTENILTYLTTRSGYLHVIDPEPRFDEATLRGRFGPIFSVHRDLSLHILPRLGRFDAILLDGDHNWYTVFHELQQIGATHQDDPLRYPLIFLHDTGWPYGRRDMYYTPETIPSIYRHMYAQLGIMPGQVELSPVGGLNWHLNNAYLEGGERNGVLTGIEDFLAQSSIDFELVTLPIQFGLSILVATARWRANDRLRQWMEELTSDRSLALLRAELGDDLSERALLERSARPYHLDLGPTLNRTVFASRDTGASHPAETPHPEISVVVVLHNMRREAPRTLYALSARYQQEVNQADYEILVVENGSSAPLTDVTVRGLDGNFRYQYLPTTAKSPAGALNAAARQARGAILGVMIDGAHLLTPGVLKYVRLAFQVFANPLVAVRYCCLGPGQQFDTVHEQGYDRTAEDALLAYIDWPQNGYRLFEIGELLVPGNLGWFHPLFESNCFFVRRELFADLNGYDERFDLPGGGWANVDFLARVMERPDVTPVSLLGEASFHQVHGGISTNGTRRDMLRFIEECSRQYNTIRGKSLYWSAAPMHYLGHMPPVAVSSFNRVRDREADLMLHHLHAKDDEIRRLASVCAERLQLIERLDQTAAERLELINRLDAELQRRAHDASPSR